MESQPSDITAGELWARSEHLAEAAARVLGRMLFEFSRLDMATGLCVVWLDEGRRREELNRSVPDMGFHARLTKIEAAVGKKFPAGSRRQKAYAA